MADYSQKGLGSDNMEQQTKKDIQSKGGQASHGGQQRSEDSLFETDMGQSEGSSKSQGSAAMKEQGRDEEVSEIVPGVVSLRMTELEASRTRSR